MKQSLPGRIVRMEQGFWRIRLDRGELDAVEQQELEDYFGEIRMPYRIRGGRLCIPESVSWVSLHGRLVLPHSYNVG